MEVGPILPKPRSVPAKEKNTSPADDGSRYPHCVPIADFAATRSFAVTDEEIRLMVKLVLGYPLTVAVELANEEIYRSMLGVAGEPPASVSVVIGVEPVDASEICRVLLPGTRPDCTAAPLAMVLPAM